MLLIIQINSKMASLESNQDKFSTNGPCTYHVLDEISCINHQLLAVKLHFPQPNKVSKHQPSVFFSFFSFFFVGSLQVRYNLGGLRGPFTIDADQRNLANGQPHSINMSRVDRSITVQVQTHTHVLQDLGLDLHQVSFFFHKETGNGIPMMLKMEQDTHMLSPKFSFTQS